MKINKARIGDPGMKKGLFNMKRISKGIAAALLICILSGCGSSAPAPVPTEAPAPEAPVMEMPPAESVAEAMPPEAPVSESVAVAEAPIEAVPAPTATPIPTATPDPLEFVRFDWKPTEEQATELYEYALPFIQDQPYFEYAEFLYGNNYIVHVNCDPADVEESALPFMRAVRDKFFELRSDVHDIIYILFMNDHSEYSYPLSISVEDVP